MLSLCRAAGRSWRRAALLVGSLAVGIGLLVSCDSSVSTTEPLSETAAPADTATVAHAPMPTGTSLPAPAGPRGTLRAYRAAGGRKSKSGAAPSPYGCYLASRPYSEEVRFRSVYLYFPEEIVEAAGGETTSLIHRLRASRAGSADTTGVRYAHCTIPKADGSADVAVEQLVRRGEKSAVRGILDRSGRGTAAKTCEIEASACTIVGPWQGSVSVECDEVDAIGCSGVSEGGDNSGGSEGGTTDPYPDDGESGGGGGGDDSGGGTGEECTAIDPEPGSECEPVEPDDPCKSATPPEWCKIGCELTTTELETMFPEADSDALATFKNLVYKFGDKFGVDSKSKIKHFMGQMAFESGYEIKSAEEADFSEFQLVDQPEVSLDEPKRDGDGIFNLERVKNSPKLQFSVVYDDRDRLGNGEPSTYDGWIHMMDGNTEAGAPPSSQVGTTTSSSMKTTASSPRGRDGTRRI